MRDENPIRTLRDYSKPSHEGHRNTIELPIGNNMDLNQHLKDFLKLVDSLDLDGENRERTHLTAKLRNDILMFQQHHGESLLEAWTRFKDLLRKVPHHVGERLRKLRPDEAWATIERNHGAQSRHTNEGRNLINGKKRKHIPDDNQRNVSTSLFPLSIRQEEFEHIVMNFILDQEERVKQLEEYIKAVRDKNLIYGGMLVTKIARSFGLLTNELRDALSIEPPPHMFKKKSLIAMGVLMELQNGICVWPAPRAVEEEEEVEEEAEGDAGHEGVGGSADIYHTMSQGDLPVCQAHWMDQQDEQ
ncbi:hypothetical protein Tco_1012540 [Tanacetum coccineum]